MSATDRDTDADDADDADASLTDCSPSEKLVYKVLEYEGSLTQGEIATESRLPPRTVRYALGRLDERDLVASRVCLDDARRSKYWIQDESA